jgi:hypothetical protein
LLGYGHAAVHCNALLFAKLPQEGLRRCRDSQGEGFEQGAVCLSYVDLPFGHDRIHNIAVTVFRGNRPYGNITVHDALNLLYSLAIAC